MTAKKEPEEVVTKTGYTIKESWCRKCAKMRPATEFFECVDLGVIDTQGIMSVCKDCIQLVYNKLFAENQSMEKAIHKLCIYLNIKFSNEALSATKLHVSTLLDKGKNVSAIFGIYKMKLTATNPSMTKNVIQDLTYEDVGVIFTEKQINVKETPIPKDVIDFWGKDLIRSDIEFLETEYANFKNTHRADSYAEIVLLKQVCYTMLDIKKLRANGDDTGNLVKELQALMKNLAISPNVVNQNAANKGVDAFGLWIQDIERDEPAQWLKTDSRGDIYRDVGNTEEYFRNYIVRPLKNFILGSKDFNVNENDIENDFELDPNEINDFAGIDDGELE